MTNTVAMVNNPHQRQRHGGAFVTTKHYHRRDPLADVPLPRQEMPACVVVQPTTMPFDLGGDAIRQQAAEIRRRRFHGEANIIRVPSSVAEGWGEALNAWRLSS